MKKILLFLFFAISFASQSQTFKISGEINTEKNEIAAGVSIILFSDKTMVKAEIANNQGRYTFRNVKPGTYSIKTSFIGYEEVILSSVIVASEDVVLLPIQIKESSTQLSEVVVKKEKPMIQVLADKTVFNVENTINAVGNSGFEILRKAPGVVIDNNDNLIVEGKNGVQIYIDGKPSYLGGTDLVNYLKTIQANDIEAIEIITQPSSKYDAAGVAGIVNIKLKKNKNFGTNGTVTTGLNVGKFGTNFNSVSFNNRNKKNNFYGNYSNRFGRNYNFINLYRSQSNTIFDSESKTINENNANNLKLGYDYYHNAKSTFGIVLSGNFNNAYGNSATQTQIDEVNPANDRLLLSSNDVHNKTSNLLSNLNYKYQGANEKSFNVDLDFGKFKSDKGNYQPNRTYNAMGFVTNITSQLTPIDIFISSLKSDYEQQLLKGKIGVGFKTSVVKTKNNSDVYDESTGAPVFDVNASNNFNYTENINAVYLNYNRNLKKINFQLGLRVENTNSDGELTSEVQNERVKRNYTDFFPSGGVTYLANDNNSFALIYSRRIERPSYQSLNPFKNQLDQYTGNRGNPFLQPQYTDNLKLSHTFKFKLITTLSYSFISDFFAQVSQAEGTDGNYLISKNVANNEVINLGISYPFKVNKWWNVYTSINAFSSRYIPTDPAFKAQRQETLNLYGQNTFNIGKDLTMEVSGWYNSPSVWGGTYRTSSLGSVDVAFQKKFLNKKLNARIAFSDIFYTSPWTGESEFGGVSISGDGGNDSRQVRFSLSYNFGRDEVKKARTRNTGVEDEKNRIGG
ncbi:MAG: outer membrane beta-barrel family protein [Bacteroidota bacterium]